MNISYFDILGISNTSSKEEIKKAYRKKTFMYHPDRNNTTADKNKFNEINEAYTYLINNYDIIIKNNNNDFEKTSKINLSKTNSINSLEKIKPITKHISINLDDVYHGTAVPINIKRLVIHNNKEEYETEIIYIDIHKGVDNNEIITIKNKGNIINEVCGDIKIIINIENNYKNIERKGLNLIYKKPISLKESLCGCCFSLKHPSGKIYKINNKKGNVLFERKVLKNMGLKRDKYIGDLIIEFDVIFPSKLAMDVIETLENIL